jgi:hypothetical protein
MSPEIDDETRDRLRMIRDRLDPIALLDRIRMEQAILAELASGCEVVQPPQTTDLDQFVQSLSIAFRGGEVRATHRKKERVRPAAPRHWRTRADPFDGVWARLEHQLVESPDITALDLFKSLQLDQPGRYPDGQLRTLQRRVKAWRTKAARKLLGLDDETTIAGVSSVRFSVSLESSVSS